MTGLEILLALAGLAASAFVLSRRGAGWAAAGFAIVLVLFAAPLLGRWQTGRSDGAAIGGLLPFSDATGYYHCAAELWEGRSFRDTGWSVLCSRRPLFVSTFAAVLGACGGSLRLTLFVFTIVAAFWCFAAARELARLEGGLAGGVLVVLLSLFHRMYAHAALSEHLGLPAAAAALAFLLRFARSGGAAPAGLGLLLLGLALAARPGAVFVAAAALAWVGFATARDRRWRTVTGGLLALLAGFGLDAALGRSLGDPAHSSNLAYPLYGAVFGHDFVATDHPELRSGGPAAEAAFIYGVVKRELSEHPSRVVFSLAHTGWRALTRPGLFAFVPLRSLRIPLLMAAFAGVALAWRFRDQSAPRLLLAAAAGTLVSLPLLPPWVAGIRAHAATMPFLCALPAFALARTFAMARKSHRAPAALAGDERRSLSPVLAVAGVLCAVVPCAGLWLPRGSAFQPSDVAPGESGCGDGVVFRWPVGAAVHIAPNTSPTRARHVLLQREFRSGLDGFRADYPGLGGELHQLRAPVVLLSLPSLYPVEQTLLVAEPQSLPTDSRPALLRACTTPAANPQSRQWALRYARQVMTMGQTIVADPLTPVPRVLRPSRPD